MKKLFTLLTLLLCTAGMAWGDNIYEYTNTPALNTNDYFTVAKGTSAAGTFSTPPNVTLEVTLANNTSSTITKMVKMENGTTISFTTATTSSTVYVGLFVRNAVSSNASNNKFKFDNTTYEASNSTEANSYEIVEFSNVKSGSHTITRDSKEVEVYYVKVVESGSALTKLSSPTINFDASTGEVSIPTVTNATKITYTTNGIDPTSESTEYDATNKPVVSDGTVFKAIAIGDGANYSNSDVTTATILLTGITCATPIINSYNGSVAITTTTPNATIKYSIDGGTTYSNYSRSFTLSSDATVTAYAERASCTNSSEASANVSVLAENKSKTIYLNYNDFTIDGYTATGKANTDAEGYVLTIGNTSKAWSSNNINITTPKGVIREFKLSNGAQNTLTIPEGVNVTKITFYSIIHSDDHSMICGWKEVGGVNYQNGEGNYANVPMGAYNDVTDYNTNPDVRAYPIDQTGGTITFTNAGYQMSFVIALDVLEIQTKYQAPTIAVGDFNFENKGYEVTITASEGELQVSTDGTTYATQASPYVTHATETTTYYAKVTGTNYDDSDVAEKEVINTFDSSKKYVAWVYTKGYGAASYTFDGDPMVQALQDVYNVVEVNNSADTAPSADLAKADLIVCTEAMTGNKALSNSMKGFVGTTPMIGLKMFNYTKDRWSWGTPANPSPTATSFTPKSQLYKVLSGVTFEADGTIQLSTATSGNVVQTVQFGTPDTNAPTGNVIMGTVGDDETKAMMHAAGNYFGLGLSSDAWSSYTANAVTIVKNAAAMLIAGEDLTSEVVSIAITSAGWATFSCTKEVAIPEGVTAYVVSKKGEDKVTLSEIEGNIPAETGVVVSGDEGTYAANITNTGAGISTTNYLVAWTTAGEPSETDYYTLAVDGGNPVFKKSSGGTLAAGKAYLVLPTVSGTRLSVDFDGGVTTIAAPTAIATMEAGKAEVYNLQGQRVSTPTKGLYIVGGKKVMKK